MEVFKMAKNRVEITGINTSDLVPIKNEIAKLTKE